MTKKITFFAWTILTIIGAGWLSLTDETIIINGAGIVWVIITIALVKYSEETE